MYEIPMSRRLAWLTPRERAVLMHMTYGRTVEEMAAEDFVAVTTVRSQIRGVLTKLGVDTQLAAVAAFYEAVWDDQEARVDALTRVLEAAVA